MGHMSLIDTCTVFQCFILVHKFYGFDKNMYNSIDDARRARLRLSDTDNWHIIGVSAEFYHDRDIYEARELEKS